MSFGDETGDYSSIYNGNFLSVDSKKFNNKLSIEETYAEIDEEGNFKYFGKKGNQAFQKPVESSITSPEYATVDINKKREARRAKSETANAAPQANDSNVGVIVYEDVDDEEKNVDGDNNIYELVSSDTDDVTENLYSECYDGTDKFCENIYSEIN